MLDVRDLIKPAIYKSGLKQGIVAERSGLTEQKLCDIINKRRRLEANEMINICRTLNITPNDLLVISLSYDSEQVN